MAMTLKTVEVNVKDMQPELQKEALKRGYSMDGTAPVEYEDTQHSFVLTEAPLTIPKFLTRSGK